MSDSRAGDTAPDRTRSSPPGQRRRVLIGTIILTLLLSFGWIGLLVAFQVLRGAPYNYRAETQRVLELIRDGNAAQVYQESSPRMQRTMISERFLELASEIRGTLGGFREISAIKQVGHLIRPGGEVGRARATLIFDHGKTSASFSYHRIDGQWRLLGFDIDIPAALEEAALSRSETRAARTEAPAEVHALAQSVLELVQKDLSAAVYDQASPMFQRSISRAAFLELQARRRQALGRYVRILDIQRSRRSQDRTFAEVTLLAEYEKARAPVTLGFLLVNDRWLLSEYKVVMPLPRGPRTPVSGPGGQLP